MLRPSASPAFGVKSNWSPVACEFPQTMLFLNSSPTPLVQTPPAMPLSARGWVVPPGNDRLRTMVLSGRRSFSRGAQVVHHQSPAPPKSSPPTFSRMRLFRTVAAERKSTIPAPYRPLLPRMTLLAIVGSA